MMIPPEPGPSQSPEPDPDPKPDLETGEDDAAPRPLFSAGFWAALALGLMLMLAGAVVGLFGPRLLPPAHPQATLNH
jgi:hypothetical protein